MVYRLMVCVIIHALFREQKRYSYIEKINRSANFYIFLIVNQKVRNTRKPEACNRGKYDVCDRSPHATRKPLNKPVKERRAHAQYTNRAHSPRYNKTK